jgi:hypothetical protein
VKEDESQQRRQQDRLTVIDVGNRSVDYVYIELICEWLLMADTVEKS